MRTHSQVCDVTDVFYVYMYVCTYVICMDVLHTYQVREGRGEERNEHLRT